MLHDKERAKTALRSRLFLLADSITDYAPSEKDSEVETMLDWFFEDDGTGMLSEFAAEREKREKVEKELEQAREVMRELMPYNSKHNSWGAREALESAITFLNEYFASYPHNHAVSDCPKCNLSLVIGVVERQIEALKGGEKS